jgi:ribosomal protein S18
MNNADFTYILQQPQSVTPQQTNDVKSIIEQFPYFQSARALYLKGLKNQDSFKYNQELKTTAAYTSDRSILFDFITSEAFIQNEVSQYIKQHQEHLLDINVHADDISIHKSVSIDLALKQQIEDAKDVLDPTLFQPKKPRKKVITHFTLDDSKTIENVTKETKTEPVSAEDILKLGKPLQFDKRETHSFNEWLNLTRFKPINREISKEKIADNETVNNIEQETQESIERAKKFELIDKFISENPKIPPVKTFTPSGNIANDRMIQPETLMTETLARIYVEQKNYKKAIQSYKILSLKYPEKSSFFAIQIKAVEQLQEHNNK